MTNPVQANSWSAEALFSKALLFTEQMNSSNADEWKYGLWSSLSLELLARASLANISPALLAEPNNWRNIMHALGNAPTAKKFTPNSIGTKEVLARLSELLPDFTQEVAGFCSKHVERRNAELHSGEIVFSGLGTSEWLPKYFKACQILLASLGKTLDDFVADPTSAQQLIDSLDDAAAKAVDQDIKAHAKVWENKEEGSRNEAAIQAQAWATRHAGHRAQCPSCRSPALLQGSPSGTVSTTVSDDVVIQRQTMLPTSFECIACGLKISGFSKLSACGLGDAFTAKTTYTAAEFFELYTEEELEEARNEMPEYEPDFNEY
ncbi:MAG: hypothetical protein JAY68_13840 [Candidatus Thiodiazotropha taylori]|nr:hypothetical protein [Candidatus Thiodiazotropha taylori]